MYAWMGELSTIYKSQQFIVIIIITNIITRAAGRLVVLLCVLCFLCVYRSLCTFSVFFMSTVCIVWLLYMGLVA